MCLFKKRKKETEQDEVQLYAIHSDVDFGMNSLITIVSSKSQVEEFCKTKILQNHQEHYKSWCSIRNLDEMNADNVQKYLSILQLEENFFVKPFKISSSVLTALLRMFYDCQPIGCSYETAEEQNKANFDGTDKMVMRVVTEEERENYKKGEQK